MTRGTLLLALRLASPGQAAPDADAKLRAAMQSPTYRAFLKEHEAAKRSGTISASSLERLHTAHAALRPLVDDVLTALYELQFAQDARSAELAGQGLKRVNVAFPSYEAAFGGSGVHLEESRAYWGSLASIAEKGDARTFLGLPVPPEWPNMRSLTDLAGCYDPALVPVDDILRLKAGADSLRSLYLRGIAKQRLDKYLEFAPAGFCVCVSLSQAKRQLAQIDERLAPQGLRLGAELTPKSNTYGERNCRTE